jgi:hypothetical protein
MFRYLFVLLILFICKTSFSQDSTKLSYRIYNQNLFLFEDSIMVKKYIDGGNPKPFFEHYSFINSLNSIHLKGGDSITMYIFYPLYCSRYYSFQNSNFTQTSPDYYFSEGGNVIRDKFLISFSENDTIAYSLYPAGPIPIEFGLYAFKIIFDSKENYFNEINNTSFNLYPNPSTGLLNIDFDKKYSNKNITLKVYDINNRLVYKNKDLFIKKKQIDLSWLENGIYFFKLELDDVIYQQKIIIQK